MCVCIGAVRIVLLVSKVTIGEFFQTVCAYYFWLAKTKLFYKDTEHARTN
jgi:hypothetical protein